MRIALSPSLGVAAVLAPPEGWPLFVITADTVIRQRTRVRMQ